MCLGVSENYIVLLSYCIVEFTAKPSTVKQCSVNAANQLNAFIAYKETI